MKHVIVDDISTSQVPLRCLLFLWSHFMQPNVYHMKLISFAMILLSFLFYRLLFHIVYYHIPFCMSDINFSGVITINFINSKSLRCVHIHFLLIERDLHECLNKLVKFSCVSLEFFYFFSKNFPFLLLFLLFILRYLLFPHILGIRFIKPLLINRVPLCPWEWFLQV